MVLYAIPLLLSNKFNNPAQNSRVVNNEYRTHLGINRDCPEGRPT